MPQAAARPRPSGMMAAAKGFVYGPDGMAIVAATGCNTVNCSTHAYNPSSSLDQLQILAGGGAPPPPLRRRGESWPALRGGLAEHLGNWRWLPEPAGLR